MSLLQKFIDYLFSQKSKPSLLTVKNYKADIGQFILWFEKSFKFSFDGSKVTSQIIDQYKNFRNLSPTSIKRHTSSLRKFFHFLKINNIISQDPLEKMPTPSAIQALEDPWMIRNFKSFLYEYNKSSLTIKNYINDVKGFSEWLTKVALVRHGVKATNKNLLNMANASTVEEYKQRLIEAKFSPRTINRKLSSLRSYLGWAQNQGPINKLGSSTNSLPQMPNIPRTEGLPTEVRRSSFAPIRFAKSSIKGINFLFDNLFILPLAQTLEAILHLFWRVSGENIFNKTIISKSAQNPLVDNGKISNIKKEFYAPLDVSTRYFPLHKRIWHHLRYVRPNWYKQYHSYPFAHYLHFSILMILSCAIGLGLYSGFFADTQRDDSVLGTATNSSTRILSFQGKLTNLSEIPISNSVKILFSLYGDANAPPTAALWKEYDNVSLDSSGAFLVFLGKNTAIPDSVFNQNLKLYLGITVGDSSELQPRQEVATASLASNSQTLQGLKLISDNNEAANVVLALDSFGNLSITDSKAHAFQVIDGQFMLSGTVLSLATAPESNGNIEIVPDGTGIIDFKKPIHNSSNNNNLTLALGSIEFDDSVGILATTSAQSALNINQNSTGALLSAYTNGSAKFTVRNDGSGMFAGNLDINGDNLFSAASTFNLLNSSAVAINIGGLSSTINVGSSTGTTFIKSNLSVDKDFILSSLSSNGGILYTNESGKVLQISARTNSDCLIGGSIPSFIPCVNMIGQIPKVGIGTTNPLFKLDVQDSQDSTAAAQIYNTSIATTAAGLIIKLGNTSASVSPSNRFINFETAGIGIVGSVQGSGAGATFVSGNADFAEYLKKDKDQAIESGSIICLDDNGFAVKCSDTNNKIIGVASERPAFLGGENLGNSSIAIGLMGQIETFVAIFNEQIKAGDTITTSNIPGVAVKSTKAGLTVGKALENLNSSDESRIIGYYDPDNKEYRSKANFPNIPLKSNIVRIAKIAILVNPSWYDPNAYLTQNGELIINKVGLNDYSLSNSEGEAITGIGGFWKIIAADIKAGLVSTGKTVTDTLIVTSDRIIINGQNLRDYIVSIIQDPGINFNSALSKINTDQLLTNIISPLSSPSLIVKLASSSGSLIVENATGSAIAKIDDQGNARFAGDVEARRASFSGTINSLSLITNDASISGTLRAQNIIADSITGIDAIISNIYSSNFADLASYSAQLSFVEDFAANRAQFNQGLMVFGPTILSDLSVAERLSIGGTMFITQNSIETLGTDLTFQSLKQGGLSIMGGLVYIDTLGNLRIQGDLFVTGKLAVNVISPLPTSDLVVNNASGSGVLSINQAGDIVSSGSGTFSKLNLNFIQPVLAISATEVIASSSAGITSIAPYQSEVTIKNALVTSKSVIYITPVGTPSALTPFLMRQVPNALALQQGGSFTVGVQSPTNHSLDFNWLIIN